MVYGTIGHYSTWRSLTFWIYFYRDVFHFHLFLGLQNLLRLWIHAFGLRYPGNCHCLCYHCLHLFPFKCRGL